MSNSLVNAMRSKTALANSQDYAPRERSKRRQNKTNLIYPDESNRSVAPWKITSEDHFLTKFNRRKEYTAEWLELKYERVREPYWKYRNYLFFLNKKFALKAPHDGKPIPWFLECIQMEQRIESRIEDTNQWGKQLYTTNHTLINLWSGREQTHSRLSMLNEWENISVGEDVLIDALMSPFDDQQLFNTKGHRLLEKWKRTSGKSKTWKRCPRAKESQQSPCSKTTSPANFGGCQFFASLLWIPSTFVRSEQKVWSLQVKRLTRNPKAKQKCKWRDTQIMNGRIQVTDSWDTQSFPQMEYSPEKSSDQWAAVQVHPKPSAVFIRFTWKDMILVKGSGDFDRFLPTGLVLHSCWRVEYFLRNDSHADVYRVSNIQQSSRLSLEAHVFLYEYHSNCKTFAKRHKHRLEKSGNCAAKLWYQDRHVLVMTVPKHFEYFKLKNNEEEYPSLNNKGKGSKTAVLSRYFQGKPTYAAIVRKGIAERRAANRLQDMRLGKVNETVLDTWLDQEISVREKKAKKQRDKRQMQRGMKRTQKNIEDLMYA